ncbi:hypothetical protein V2A60_002646 [Cordyceps javanica]|uniref:Protamine P1 n=1 Tax=Cordyceps javanica TaxID=43265 RepID=A0A545UXZ5_9HYPO|nr:protamine P1 [Cordyceps javanica]
MTPRASRSNWPLVDTIYCEAKCPDEDVYYVGSDDDQYESPRERKRRYELAGQRFLAGSAPRLFSASLAGPFEGNRGWKNPWASKTQLTRIARQPDRQTVCVSKALDSIKSMEFYANHATNPRLDSSECHLPSPQSLKTTSLAPESHPFLEDEEFRAVQAWRHSILSTDPDTVQRSASKDIDAAPPRKRKASHNWLKTVPEKRSRAECTEFDTSRRADTWAPALPDLSTQHDGQANLDTNDRLAPNTELAPRAPTSQLISPPKQTSAPKNTATAPLPTIIKLDGEVGELRQAATLSSPVSLRNVKQEEPATQLSPLKFKTKVSSSSNAAPEKSGASPPNTTAVHYTFSNDTTRKPYQVSDDEGFVFDIALDPLSDSSESEEDESSRAPDHTADAAMEGIHHESPASDKETGRENDDSSDSELSELSDSPELSYLDSSAEESEADAMEGVSGIAVIPSGVCAETKRTVKQITPEAVHTGDDAHVGQSAELENGCDSEERPSAETDSKPENTSSHKEVDEVVQVAASLSALGEVTGRLMSDESHGGSGAETVQLRQVGAVEEGVESRRVNHVPSIAVEAEAHALNEARVTAVPLTQSAAGNVVPPSPTVKQESSDFSLKAILRSIVPKSSWAQLTRRASSSAQVIQQPVPLTTMEEQVLPSVEDVFAEEHEAPIVHQRSSEADESMTIPTGESGSAEEPEENRGLLLSEQDSAIASGKLPTAERRATKDDTPPTRQEKSTSPEQHQVISDSGLTVNDMRKASVAQDRTPSSGRDITPPPSLASVEVPPPVATPVTPVRTESSMPVSKANSPEPRFAIKSFAAFSTPSPERLRVKKRRRLQGSSLRHPSVKGILTSRHAGSPRRTNNRVSWLLPDEHGPETSGLKDRAGVANRDGPSSPPPRTPLAELPTASNEKFSKHFSLVVKRTDGLRHRFHVAADTDGVVDSPVSTHTQQKPSSTAPKSTAEAGTEKPAALVETTDVENQCRTREATLSVEPMDMVEDMVREMGDFWQAWDVDAELSAAKKAQAAASVSGSQSQTAWR